MQRVERMAPGVPVVMLVERAHHWPMLRRVVGENWIVGPGIKELREHPKLGRKITERGHDLHVWTVNTPAGSRPLPRARGQGGIISDRPA